MVSQFRLCFDFDRAHNTSVCCVCVTHYRASLVSTEHALLLIRQKYAELTEKRNSILHWCRIFYDYLLGIGFAVLPLVASLTFHSFCVRCAHSNRNKKLKTEKVERMSRRSFHAHRFLKWFCCGSFGENAFETRATMFFSFLILYTFLFSVPALSLLYFPFSMPIHPSNTHTHAHVLCTARSILLYVYVCVCSLFVLSVESNGAIYMRRRRHTNIGYGFWSGADQLQQLQLQLSSPARAMHSHQNANMQIEWKQCKDCAYEFVPNQHAHSFTFLAYFIIFVIYFIILFIMSLVVCCFSAISAHIASPSIFAISFVEVFFFFFFFIFLLHWII